MQPFQYELRCSAAKDNSINYACSRGTEQPWRSHYNAICRVGERSQGSRRAGGERRTGERAARTREMACVSLTASAAAAVSLLGWGGRLVGRSWARRLVGRGDKGFPAPGVELTDAAQQGGTPELACRAAAWWNKKRGTRRKRTHARQSCWAEGRSPPMMRKAGGDHELGRRLEATDRTGEFRRQVGCGRPRKERNVGLGPGWIGSSIRRGVGCRARRTGGLGAGKRRTGAGVGRWPWGPGRKGAGMLNPFLRITRWEKKLVEMVFQRGWTVRCLFLFRWCNNFCRLLMRICMVLHGFTCFSLLYIWSTCESQ